MALHHAQAGEIVDLGPLGEGLKSAATAAIVKTEAFETIRLIVHKGDEIPPHEVRGATTFHCLEGRVRLGLPNSRLDLAAGQWVFLEGGATHSVTGLEESCVLLTILFAR